MDDVRDRMKQAMGDMRPADLWRLTGENQTTISRYLRDRDPSVAFLISFCLALKIPPTWLLLGQGPMRLGEVDLSTAPEDALNAELAARKEQARLRSEAVMTYIRMKEPEVAKLVDEGLAAIRQGQNPDEVNIVGGIELLLASPGFVQPREPGDAAPKPP